LLDFHLPETTGPELLQQLGAVRPLPSILMSGLANPAEVAAAQRAGFFTFLRKPLDLNRLRQSLEMLIQQHFGGPLATFDHPEHPSQGYRPRPRQHPHHPKAPPPQ
jgi:DNA-binding response OmpR family regulator